MTDPTQPTAEQAQQQAELIHAWLQAPVPRFYANGLAVAQTASDVAIAFSLNGTPTAILNLSHITAKSLATEITRAIADYEQNTGQKVKEINEVTADLVKARGSGVTLGRSA